MTHTTNRCLLAAALLAAFCTTAAAAGSTPAADSLRDYTCWSLLTEPEDSAGYSELFYLGYAMGEARIELPDEAAYKRVLAASLERCRAEPEAKVLTVFAEVLDKG